MVFSRNKFYFIGLFIIFGFYLLNRVNFINKSDFAVGTVLVDKEMELSFTQQNDVSDEKVIEFSVNNKLYSFFSNDFEKINDKDTYRVIYDKKNPHNAYVFSFLGFWLSGLLYCLLPIMVWSAFVYSYISPKEHVFINLLKFKFKKVRNTNNEYFLKLKK